jgi:hypothetical protein
MESHSNLATGSERRPQKGRIWTLVLITIFFILLMLLGQSMVQHRFFRGEREHQNGSIGQ